MLPNVLKLMLISLSLLFLTVTAKACDSVLTEPTVAAAEPASVVVMRRSLFAPRCCVELVPRTVMVSVEVPIYGGYRVHRPLRRAYRPYPLARRHMLWRL